MLLASCLFDDVAETSNCTSVSKFVRFEPSCIIRRDAALGVLRRPEFITNKPYQVGVTPGVPLHYTIYYTHTQAVLRTLLAEHRRIIPFGGTHVLAFTPKEYAKLYYDCILHILCKYIVLGFMGLRRILPGGNEPVPKSIDSRTTMCHTLRR